MKIFAYMLEASVSCSRVSSALSLAIVFLARVKLFLWNCTKTDPRSQQSPLPSPLYYKLQIQPTHSHSDLAHRWSCGRAWAWLGLISPKSNSTLPPPPSMSCQCASWLEGRWSPYSCKNLAIRCLQSQLSPLPRPMLSTLIHFPTMEFKPNGWGVERPKQVPAFKYNWPCWLEGRQCMP